MNHWYNALAAGAGASVLVLALASGRQSDERRTADAGSGVSKERCDQILASWPAEARKAAEKVIEKYGPPQEVTEGLLCWKDTGPWKKTLVHREEVQHDFPMPHKDVLEQFVDYRVPVDMFSEIARYDGSVVCKRTNGEISARCDKEEMNFLAINLTNDIVNRKKTVEDARAYFARAAKAFMNGEKDPYTQGFRSDGIVRATEAGSSRRGTADPDQPFKDPVKSGDK
jgi:hypothetical protein